MNSQHIDRSGMIPINDISDADPVETRLLQARADEAGEFLGAFKWCRAIRGQLFAGGFSHAAVFFFEIENGTHPDDKYLWVVVGDLPPAYLVIDEIPDYKEALLAYVHEMRQWVDAAKNGKSVRDYIPVNVDPTTKNALMLESRLNFIEHECVPALP